MKGDRTDQAKLRVHGGAQVECPFDFSNAETFWHAKRSAGVLLEAIRAVGEER